MSSSITGSGSASSSLPENLGVGSNYSSAATASAVELPPKLKAELDKNIETVKKLYSNLKPTKAEVDVLNTYIIDLIEHPAKESVVDALKGMVKKDCSSTDENAVNGLALFVAKMKRDAVKMEIIQQKFKTGTALEYRECYLIDELAALEGFTNKMTESGVKDNKYINTASSIYKTAEENAFREFQDGDVLFYDIAAAEEYRGNSLGFFDRITMSALGTNYTHVGVFYRNDAGKPCVSEIQGRYSRHRLYFGQQCYIKGKRIEPSKLTATQLTAAERTEVQKKIGQLYSYITAGTNWDISITLGQQLGCVFSHTTSLPNTKLDRVKLKGGGENLLCSEFAAKGLMQAFEEFNKEKHKVGTSQKEVILMNPFSEYEDLATLHPERMLVVFGPHKGTEKLDSAWEDVQLFPPGQFLPLAKMLPQAPAFPDLSYAKTK